MKKSNLLFLFLFIFITSFSKSFGQCKPSILLPFNGNAKDSSGNGKHGTVVGATLTTDRNGKANSAYFFDGIDDHIVIADDTANDLNKVWTIMAWVKPEVGYGNFKDNHVAIVDKWGNAGSGLAAYGMGIHTNGELEGFTHTGSYGTYKWSNGIVNTGVWSHLAVVRGADDSIRLYINKVLDNTYKSQVPQNSNFSLHIGMASDPSIQLAYPNSYRFHGAIDNVAIYKCALKPSQFTSSILTLSEFSNAINVFPNPSSNGILHINQNISNNYEIKVFDINGKNILNSNNHSNIDLSNYSKGMYCIKFTDLDNKLTVTKKIMVN